MLTLCAASHQQTAKVGASDGEDEQDEHTGEAKDGIRMTVELEKMRTRRNANVFAIPNYRGV